MTNTHIRIHKARAHPATGPLEAVIFLAREALAPTGHMPSAREKNGSESASARLLLQPSNEKDESVDGTASASKSRRLLDLQDGA